MSGKRLAVKVERDGQLVGQVNADVDLPKLLATVFATTSRERGEVPFAVGESGELYTPDARGEAAAGGAAHVRAQRRQRAGHDGAPGLDRGHDDRTRPGRA